MIWASFFGADETDFVLASDESFETALDRLAPTPAKEGSPSNDGHVAITAQLRCSLLDALRGSVGLCPACHLRSEVADMLTFT